MLGARQDHGDLPTYLPDVRVHRAYGGKAERDDAVAGPRHRFCGAEGHYPGEEERPLGEGNPA